MTPIFRAKMDLPLCADANCSEGFPAFASPLSASRSWPITPLIGTWRSQDQGSISGWRHRTQSVTPDANADQNLIDLWLAGRPGTTRLAYTQDIRTLRLFVNKPLRDLQSEDLMRFACGLQGSPASQARRIATVKSLFAFAARLGARIDNPAVVLKCPRVEGSVHGRILDEDEVAAVISEAAPGRDRCLIRTLYVAGLRTSEVLGITFSDLGRQWITVRGKGSRTRTVVVPEALIAELRLLRWRADPDDGYVFKGQAGGRLSARFLTKVVRRAAEEAIAKPISAHWLRHSHATHALQGGAPIHLLQQSLGHRSLATTATYLHVRPGQGSSQYLMLR